MNDSKIIIPRVDNEYTMQVPPEIREMAMKIEDYFMEHGIEKWALMNICSRNHIDDSKPLAEKLYQIEKILK